MPAPPRVLAIAGSDPGGGAGIQADLKTFLAHGVHGMAALTATTVQDSTGVHAVHPLPGRLVAEQARAVLTDIGADAVKTGMLGSADVADAVAALAAGDDGGLPNLVVDPVAASTGGRPLLDDNALAILRDRILPRATVVTPNLDEVRLLTGVEVRAEAGLADAARAVHALGPAWVLVKGGHLPGGPDAVDVLFDGRRPIRLAAPRLANPNTHGTGCTLASAIAANLASGLDVPTAVADAKAYLNGALAAAYPLGAGTGPLDHAWRMRAAGFLRPGGPSHPSRSSATYAANPYEG